MASPGLIACPTCGSNRTKTARDRRAMRNRRLGDGGILRGHRCEDCGQLFLSVQRTLLASEADDLYVDNGDEDAERSIRSEKRIEGGGLSPLAHFREDARAAGLSIREYEREAGILLMPAQKEIAANEVSGDLDRLEGTA